MSQQGRKAREPFHRALGPRRHPLFKPAKDLRQRPLSLIIIVVIAISVLLDEFLGTALRSRRRRRRAEKEELRRLRRLQ